MCSSDLYELKHDIDTKKIMLAILKGKLRRNLALLEAVEREVVCVKLAIDETCQMLRGKEDEGKLFIMLKLFLTLCVGFIHAYTPNDHISGSNNKANSRRLCIKYVSSAGIGFLGIAGGWVT